MSPEWIALIAGLGGAFIGGVMAVIVSFLQHRWNQDVERKNRERAIRVSKLNQIEENVGFMYQTIVAANSFFNWKYVHMNENLVAILRENFNENIVEMIIGFGKISANAKAIDDDELTNSLVKLPDIYFELEEIVKKYHLRGEGMLDENVREQASKVI